MLIYMLSTLEWMIKEKLIRPGDLEIFLAVGEKEETNSGIKYLKL